MQWAEYFNLGGPYVYAVAALGFFAIISSALAFLTNIVKFGDKTRMARMTSGALTLFFVVISFAIAGMAMFIASQNAADAVTEVAVENRALLQERAAEYIRIPLTVASFLNAVPFLIGVITFVRGIKTPKP